MRMATWAWFSPRARVPRGAPCIFGSIQQTRTAAYAPDTPYWPQRRLRPAIWVGRQTSSRQINMSRVAPDPKMTLISAMLANCSGTGGTCRAEYSVFCTAQAGVHQDRKEHLSFFMQSATGSMQNTKRKGSAQRCGVRGGACPASALSRKDGDTA